MTNLIKNELTLDSREVADMVNKNHKELLRDIRTYKEYLGGSSFALTDFFKESSYLSGQNKELPNYQITKKGCEFIAHKLTGQKGAIFTATYINKFHEMEEKQVFRPLTKKEEMKLYLEVLEEQEAKIQAVDEDLQSFKKDMPLLALECDNITLAVRKVGVRCLGGKASEAYQDRSLRGKVYADIYGQLKREFAVASYKAIKRNQADLAVEIINNYKLPLFLQTQIDGANMQFRMESL